MKRKVLISVLAVVLVLTLCIGVFVACNDDADKTPATKYTVTYALGEYKGTGTAPAAKEVEDSSKLTLPTATDMPAWANFTFDGWQAEGGSKLAPGAEVTVTANITYVAQWKYNFDLDDFAGHWSNSLGDDLKITTTGKITYNFEELDLVASFALEGGYTFEYQNALDSTKDGTYHIWLLDNGETLAFSKLGEESDYNELAKQFEIDAAYYGTYMDQAMNYSVTISDDGSIGLIDMMTGVTYSGTASDSAITGDATNGYTVAGKAFDENAGDEGEWVNLTFSVKLTNNGLLLNIASASVTDLLLTKISGGDPTPSGATITFLGEDGSELSTGNVGAIYNDPAFSLDFPLGTYVKGWYLYENGAATETKIDFLTYEGDSITVQLKTMNLTAATIPATYNGTYADTWEEQILTIASPSITLTFVAPSWEEDAEDTVMQALGVYENPNVEDGYLFAVELAKYSQDDNDKGYLYIPIKLNFKQNLDSAQYSWNGAWGGNMEPSVLTNTEIEEETWVGTAYMGTFANDESTTFTEIEISALGVYITGKTSGLVRKADIYFTSDEGFLLLFAGEMYKIVAADPADESIASIKFFQQDDEANAITLERTPVVTLNGADDYSKEITVHKGQLLTLPDDFPMTKAYADPNPNGYTLSFHYFNDAEGHQFDYTTTAITGNITLTAVYEIKIAYDLNGATGDLPEVKWFAATSRQYYTGFDGNCTLPTLEDLNASYEGYRFIGWMRSDTNELLTRLPGSIYYGMSVDHDITFVAQWKIIKDSYTITYKTEGSEFTTQTINHGEKATAPTPAPTYNADQSLYFAFWAIEGTTDEFDFDTEIMEDYTLEAIFRHYFSFDIGEGATGTAPAPQVMGSTRGDYTMPDSTGFSYEGKKLVGWTIQGDDTGKVYRIGEHDSYGDGQENVTFVAKWMDDAAQYTITYKAGDHATGADIITQHEPYSEVQIAESTFTGAQNYPYFKYWEVDGDEDTHKNPGDKVILTGNLTLKAVYSSELIITSGLNTLKLDLATNTGTFASYPLTFTIGADNKLDLTIDFSSADTQYCNKATGTIDIAAKQINIVIFYDYAACEYGTAKATLTTPLNGYYTSGDTELKFAFLSDGTMYAGSNTACKYYQVDANNYIADYRWMEGWSYKHYYLTIAKSSDDGSLQIDVKDDASNSGKYTLDTTTEIKAGVYTYYTKNYTLTITAGRNFTFSDGASTTFTGTYMPLYEGFYYATSGSDYFKLELQSGGGYKCTESSNSTFSSYTYEAPIELNEGEVTYLGNVSWKNGSGMFAVTYTISKLVIDPTKEVTTCVLGYTADSKYSYKRIDIEKSNYAANFDGEYADHEIAYYYSYDGTPSFVIAIYDDGTVMIGNSNDEYQGKLHKEGEEEEVQYVTVTIMPGAHGFSLYQETVTLTQGSHKVSEIVDALKAKGDDSLPKGINKFWYFNSRFKVGTDEGSTLYTSDDYNFTTNVALFAQFSDSSWYLGVTSAGTYPQFYAQSGFGNDSGTIDFYINESDEGRGGTTFNYTYDMITDTITLTNGDDTFKGTFGEITVTSQHFCALNITITVKGQEYKFGTGSPEEQSAQPIPDGVFVLSDNHSYTLTISNWTITFAGAEAEVTFTYEYSEHFSYGGDKYVGTGDYSDWEISYLSEDYISIWGATPNSYNGGYEPKPEMVHITLKAGEGAVGVDQTIEVEAGLGKAIANTYFTAKNQYWSNFRGWDKTSTATEDVAYPGLDDIEYYEGLVLYAVYSDEWAAYNEDYYYISVRLDHTTGTATFADFSEELSVNGEYTLDQTEQTISLTLDGKTFSGTWTFEDGEYVKEFTINITIEYEGSNYTFGSGSDGTGGGTEEIPSGDVTFECDLTINILANSYKLTKIVIRIDGIATSCTVTVDGKDISWTSDNINFYQEEDIEYTEYAGNGDVKYAYFTTIESQNFSAIYIYVLADGTIDISKADDGTPINESPLTYTKA